MAFERLTFRSVTARPVLLPMRRPVVSKVGLFDRWPMILIDIETEEGIVGRSYLEPYLKGSARAIISVIHELAAARAGQPIRPLDDFQKGLKAQNLVGLEGVSMIAVSGLDMAAWDALAKAANMPLAVFLGGSLGPVPAYNSNGLWLTDVASLGEEATELVAEGGFRGPQAAARARAAGRRSRGDPHGPRGGRRRHQADGRLQPGPEPRRRAAPLPRARRPGPYWLEEPIAYNNLAGFAQLARELADADPARREFLRPARAVSGRSQWAAATT
jgi:mandelate racemase